ncbi:hypothetical protein FEE95_21660 [Maribacter algarum]|uniref:Hydroxyacid dehydrogenase n=1 Tax=Maribacter algarum (ex Zhang et al. 2020) TaxID=2578118 RepID=A0A5S3PDM3_9FLAO|nr:four-carbon acid sugar kinase family protein [Maribacter algarum]TMM52021.1 hypothetical protein FEE95_21660 [Maribacter algarum]
MTDQAIIRSIREGEHGTDYRDEIRTELLQNPRTIVILDDDPTGTQTVHDVPVITQWSEEVIEREILTSPVFFILTNSRSLQAEDADALGKLIGRRLKKASAKHNKKLLVISRSDSTLRGHYPNEVSALAEGLGWEQAKELLIPAFFEGGRYTFNDIHYVKEGEEFIPAGETPFARDNTFGYDSSDLKQWVEEKTQGVIKATAVHSLNLDLIRNHPIAAVSDILNGNNRHFIVNATTYKDLCAIALASLRSKGPFIFRTAASFINAISNIELRPLLQKEELLRDDESNGGLVIIGSYVPKTTAQLACLKKRSEAVFIEFDVAKMIKSTSVEKELTEISSKIDSQIVQKKTVVLYTARDVIKGDTKEESLEIVNQVSQNLIAIVKKIKNRPKYILAKGGITSSDIAVKALKVTGANIIGQAINGVPVWRLGINAKFPELPYIVFPGNVGESDALYNVIQKLS